MSLGVTKCHKVSLGATRELEVTDCEYIKIDLKVEQLIIN